MQIYRKNQGRWTRLGTVGAAGLLIVIGAWYAWSELSVGLGLFRAIIPLVFMLACFYILLRVVNSKRPADFMIATEGEMKKVSWSSKKEIIGSTKVVITTLLLMGLFLFLVDLSLKIVMQALGVQQY